MAWARRVVRPWAAAGRHFALATWPVLFALWAGLAGRALAAPVTFHFEAPPTASGDNPFARELWAEVVVPGGRTLVLPAYFEGNDRYAVRARADQPGTYRLGAITETVAGNRRVVPPRGESPTSVEVKVAETLPAVGRDPARPDRFLASDGRPLVPVGANVAWAEVKGDPVPFYRDAFDRFGAAGLNWMRIWMCHWGRLNLDWQAATVGPSPRPGYLEPEVAAAWDQIVERAEQAGVYVQMVLQHHGQYSSRVNSNWKENPWNAANPGGFLNSPDDFFTSPDARRLTKLKYRYIVARWGWSPAIFAWELFNEVHWVDAMSSAAGEARVGAWHTEMADWIRSIDVYHHLVTTSTENLASPCYARMDFYQPHLYPTDLILGARSVPLPAGGADRPVFYGEQGDDHLDVPAAIKAAGTALVPPAWAGLFSVARMPAQPWLGATLLKQDRAGELGAVRRFVDGSHLADEPDLVPFSAVMKSESRVPLALVGCQHWQRRPAPTLAVPLDGRMPVDLATVPRVYAAPIPSEGFPSEGSYRFEFAQPVVLHAQIVAVGPGSPKLQFLIDGRLAIERRWTGAAVRPTETSPELVPIPMPAGSHTLTVRNAGREAWIEISSVDLGVQVSALAALGQRNANFVALWIWNRSGLLAVHPTPVAGTAVIADLPAGAWRITWWNTETGRPAAPETIVHRGGPRRILTPPIARHAAVVLTRM